MKKSTPPRPRGRPRSDSTRRAILAATLRLLRNETVQSVTIEAIAKSAGVSKATIYRRWPGKRELVLDAVRTRVADIQLEMGCLGCGVPRSLAASPDGARHIRQSARGDASRPAELGATLAAALAAAGAIAILDEVRY